MASLLLVAAGVAAAGERESAELPRFPAISPDGEELVFSWAGDLWRVDADGGAAVRVTGHELDDLRASWSADGETIVFSSLRDGYLNLWRVGRDGAGLQQLTHGDRFLRDPSFGRDAEGEPVITFSGYLEADVYREQRPYAIPPEGGPRWRLHDAFGSEPRVSPDGRYVAFTRGGAYHSWSRRHYRGPDARDIWLYDRVTERFSPVTARDGDDGQPHWAGDETLIFLSDRADGTLNLYRKELGDEPGSAERLTQRDSRDVLSLDVAAEAGKAVLHAWDRLYTLDLDDADAEPQPVPIEAGEPGHDRYELRRVDREVTEARLSPDGEVMAYIAYGRVYVRHMDEHSPTRPVTPDTHARHQDLRWSPDGLRLYFTRDEGGTESIHAASVALTREEVRQGRVAPEGGGAPAGGGPSGDGPTKAPGASGDADSGSLERDDPFAPTDPVDPDPIPEPHGPGLEPEPPAPPDPPEPQPAVPQEPDRDRAEAPPPALDPERWHDALRFTVGPVVDTQAHEREARPSPDGTRLAFRRGRGDLVVRQLGTGEEVTLVEGWDATLDWRWSPCGRYIAYTQNDLDFSANVFVVPADGSEAPVNITRHPRDDLNPRWSADGRILTFISNRSGGSFDLYRVHLDPELDRYSRLELDRYYRGAREAAARREPLPAGVPPPLEVAGAEAPDVEPAPELDLERAWQRVERVSTAAADEYANEMTPGGDRYVLNRAGQGLMVMAWDGSERRRLGPVADVQHLDLTGGRAVYVADGRAGVVSLSDGEHRRPDIRDRIRIDRRAQAVQKLREAARVIEEGFYRSDLEELDWAEVVAEYEALVRRARTPSEFSDIANRLMGELAASHTGVTNPGPASALREPVGRLGIRREPVELPDGTPGYRVREVLPEGPAAVGPMPLRRGDVITAIDGRDLEPGDTLERRLRGRVGDEVLLTFRRPDEGGPAYRYALVEPVAYQALARLRYDAFREERRRKVAERSDGRLGYIHIEAMSQASLEAFQGSLYAAAEGKEGLIIDVRNNGGGHTTDRILTSIMAAEHAYTIPAGADPEATGHYPQDRLDAPRYTLPINMVINEKSYSNAEILAHAFSTLERGNLVGEQTYGGVISTGRHRLIDGATVRRPFRGWYLPDGTDMEHSGAEPDVRLRQGPEDEAAGRDRQLRAAVDDLLERLDDGS